MRIALVVVAGCWTAVPRAPGTIALAPCRIDGVAEPLRCGMLDVPEDRAHPEGRHLQLPVIVLPSTDRHGAPLFEIAGGPGIAATAAAQVFANDFPQMRKLGDIVLVDQRGTGDGPAKLACPGLDDLPPSVLPGVDAVRACRAALEAHADLRFYGTVEVARDLDDARRALGYDKIDIEAISYGTRVAQVYMRLFPDRVHAAAMIGMLAMNVHLPEDFAENAQRVTDAVLDACERDADCRSSYPALRARLDMPVPSAIDRTAFTEWIRHRIYNPAGAAELPKLIAAAASGDYSAFTSAKATPGVFREAVLLAVTCSEDLPAISLPLARHRAEATWFGAGRLDHQAAACEAWPRVPVAASFYEQVASNAPVLVFAGGRDPVTPPAYARHATERMPHAHIVEVPDLGHGAEGLAGAECLDGIERAFLRDPRAPLDTSCVIQTRAPKFSSRRSPSATPPLRVGPRFARRRA